ncbi:MAG: marine proteobacterial sortase target protein [Alphaproteobacteria bacterium]
MPRLLNPNTQTNIFPSLEIDFRRAALTFIAAVIGVLVWLGSAHDSYGQVSARAGAAVGESVPAGLFFRAGRDDGAIEAPVLASDVTITVNGLVARVRVRQRFHNPSAFWLEGIYVFPLPDRSAVDRLTMTVGGQRIDGKIMERVAAAAAYDKAAAAGQRASLLSSERANIFATSVANIGPGEEIIVEIEFQDRVAYENSRFSLRFPMVVAPRYSPAPGPISAADRLPSGVQPVGHLGDTGRDRFGPVRHPTEGLANLVTLAVIVDAGLPLKSLESLYHQVRVERMEGHRRLVTLTDGSVPAVRDFVLEWQVEIGGVPQAAIFSEEVGEDSHLMVMLLPPDDSGAGASVLPRDLIFVVDTSGSMHGTSMEQAKAAVLHAIERLRPEDRFNIIGFANRTTALYRTARNAVTATRVEAAFFVGSMEAEGGTEMLPALRLALAEPAVEGRLRQVVFLTDGAVDNEAGIFDLIARQLGDTRIFAVGIGSAPNSYFMRETAELGRGSFVYIGDTNEVAERMAGLARKLAQPALTDVEIIWPAGIAGTAQVYPNPQPDLYAGEPVVMTALLPGQPIAGLVGDIKIRAWRGGEMWERSLPLGGGQGAPGVAALWARAKIAQIEGDGVRQHDSGGVRPAVLEVALRYSLVTPYTSLVAIDERPARPANVPLDSEEIARNLPEGWDYEGIFGAGNGPAKMRAMPPGLLHRTSAGASIALPQTATPAQQMILVSLVLFAFAGLLLLWGRRHGHV